MSETAKSVRLHVSTSAPGTWESSSASADVGNGAPEASGPAMGVEVSTGSPAVANGPADRYSRNSCLNGRSWVLMNQLRTLRRSSVQMKTRVPSSAS